MVAASRLKQPADEDDEQQERHDGADHDDVEPLRDGPSCGAELQEHGGGRDHELGGVPYGRRGESHGLPPRD